MLWTLLPLVLAAHQTPAEAAALAAADVRTLPAEVQPTVRYLWLANTPAEETGTLTILLQGHANQLSREPDLVPLAVVPNSGGQVLRLSLLDYGWDAKTWDDMQQTDYVFYATVKRVVIWPGGFWPEYGAHFEAGRYATKAAERTTAPWLARTEAAQKAVGSLVEATQAKAPIVHALHWFQTTAAAADGRKPSYYDMLGVKDEKTFQALIGVDLGRDKKFSREVLESVAISGVTQEPRGLERTDKIGGAYWRSYDVGRGKATEKSNPLRIFGTDKDGKPVLQYDASEQFGHLPNGLWATGLFDAKGESQAAAPDNIASDSRSVSNDRRIHVNVSCVRCHDDGGMKPIDGWVRSVFTPPPLVLQAADPKAAQRLRQQYHRALEPLLAGDRQRYAASLMAITGLEPKDYAKAYGELWTATIETPFDLVRAARDLGCTAERLKASLAWQQRSKGTIDTVLSSLLKPGAKIPYTQWVESYPLAQQYLQEYPQ